MLLKFPYFLKDLRQRQQSGKQYKQKMYYNRYLWCAIFLFVSLCSYPAVLPCLTSSQTFPPRCWRTKAAMVVLWRQLLLHTHQRGMKEADACLGSWGCTRHCILMKQNSMLLLQLDRNTKASLGFCGRTWQMLQCKGQQKLHALHPVPWQVQPLFSCTAKAKIGVNVLFSAMAGYSYGKWEIPAWGLKGRAHSAYF